MMHDISKQDDFGYIFQRRRLELRKYIRPRALQQYLKAAVCGGLGHAPKI